MKKIAINGFGRIGRNFLRSILLDQSARQKLNVVAINIGPSSYDMVGHMFKYDTLMGTYPGSVQVKNQMLYVDDHQIELLAERDPRMTQWGNKNIDWVVESSGHFTKREGAQLHLESGAKKVLISAPAQGEDVAIIPGVNDNAYDSNAHTIVSLGSCTTNAFMPMLKTLDDAFEVQSGFMTTIHAYTNTQVLLDIEDSDPRRSRAAALNIIPTTTGATKMIGKILPALEGKVSGMAIRVPVAKVSLIDLSFITNTDLTARRINDACKAVARDSMKGILDITYEPLVSSDFNGTNFSVIIDGLLTDAYGKTGKLCGWYDNEWAYSVRLRDFLMATS